jgi:isoquinoline 1-oxidoreductase subunit alpha
LPFHLQYFWRPHWANIFDTARVTPFLHPKYSGNRLDLLFCKLFIFTHPNFGQDGNLYTSRKRKKKEVEVSPGTPLLWVLQDHLGLVGTKYACGIGLCGSCTIHFDGNAVRSCSTPIEDAGNHKIVTIEGLSKKGNHPVQEAWNEEDVPPMRFLSAQADYERRSPAEKQSPPDRRAAIRP